MREWLFVIVICVFATGCGDSMKEPPQMIEADGQTFIACGTDTVYVTNEGAWFGGETTFRVKFTDANGLSARYQGHPKTACQPASEIYEGMPASPSMMPVTRATTRLLAACSVTVGDMLRR
jgi:hypothetical protein